jgi:hypothetical protein
MANDNSNQTRRTILQKGALAAGGLSFGVATLTGNVAADRPTIIDLEGEVVENPCTGESMTAIRGSGVFYDNSRVDDSGGCHINLKLLLNATFEGDETGLLYEGSLEGTLNSYISADALPTTETFVLREKFVSHGSASDFLLKILIHTTVNANGIETVDVEMESAECL